MEAKGVDVYAGSGRVDWHQVRRAGYAFCFAKATQGTDYRDPRFRENIRGARAAGLLTGAYAYCDPALGSAYEQAANFVGALSGVGGVDLPPVLDLEAAGHADPKRVTQWANEWLHWVRKGTGRPDMLYTFPWFARTYLHGVDEVPDWIADYGEMPKDVAGCYNITFWQKSDRGLVPGIPQPCDLDIFFGSEEQLVTWAKEMKNLERVEVSLNGVPWRPGYLIGGNTYVEWEALREFLPTLKVEQTSNSPLGFDFTAPKDAAVPVQQLADVAAANGIKAITVTKADGQTETVWHE